MRKSEFWRPEKRIGRPEKRIGRPKQVTVRTTRFEIR